MEALSPVGRLWAAVVAITLFASSTAVALLLTVNGAHANPTAADLASSSTATPPASIGPSPAPSLSAGTPVVTPTASVTTSTSLEVKGPEWSRCENAAAGFSVAYLRSWNTRPDGECRLFDQREIAQEERSGPPRVAIQVSDYQSFEKAVLELNDPRYSKLLLLTDTTIAGFPAWRFELQAGRFAMSTEPNELSYGYVINRDAQSFRIETFNAPNRLRAAYEDNKLIVDAMAGSLELRQGPREKRPSTSDAFVCHVRPGSDKS